MLGHLVVHAKHDRLALLRQVGPSQRTLHSLDSHTRDVADLTHRQDHVWNGCLMRTPS
jgi:hypothetical protein